MRRLVPCSSCQRHVFAGEASCPHCGATSSAPAVTALAAIAVSASLALTACERPPAAVYGPPPSDPDLRTPAPATADPDPSADPSASAPATATDTPPPPPSAEPSASASASSTASASAPSTTEPAVKRPPAAVYGPPPKNPVQRDPF
ncbi:MAG: hypothetical protein R3F14_30940 [Polyangiaceae bacterium]